MTLHIFHTMVFFWLASGCIPIQADAPTVAAQRKFSDADLQLNQVWAKLKTTLSSGEFAELQRDQRAWVDTRDIQALSPGYSGAPDDETKARRSPEYLSAAAELTTQRVEWLKGLMEPPSPDGSLTGLWTDSYGGVLQIVSEPGELFFVCEVVRGPTAHVGALAGRGTWNPPLGWFTDKGRDSSRDDETNLSLVLKGCRLEVTGANTTYYHGARAYFDGIYVKTGELDSKSIAAVRRAATTPPDP